LKWLEAMNHSYAQCSSLVIMDYYGIGRCIWLGKSGGAGHYRGSFLAGPEKILEKCLSILQIILNDLILYQ